MASTDDDFIRTSEIPLYEDIGAHARMLPVRSRADAQDTDNTKTLADCSVIFLHGGMPQWLVDTLVDTPVWRSVAGAVARGASLAGTSGGIMCLGREIFRFGESATEVSWTPGLGLLGGGFLGAHWNNDEYKALREPFDLLPADALIVSVDERTVAVGDGHDWTALGNGVVHVRDEASEKVWQSGEEFIAALRS